MDIEELKNIDWLVENGGEVSIGRTGPVACAGIACDEDICYAMLVRGSKESLSNFLLRLDQAIQKAMEEDIFIDEINS